VRAAAASRPDFTGRPDARSAGGGDPRPDGRPVSRRRDSRTTTDPLADPQVRDRLFRMEGIVK
jgi:hypothetical protein